VDEFLFLPVSAGMWKQHELWDGTYTLDDLLDIGKHKRTVPLCVTACRTGAVLMIWLGSFQTGFPPANYLALCWAHGKFELKNYCQKKGLVLRFCDGWAVIM
jgi:hypothetical protein